MKDSIKKILAVVATLVLLLIIAAGLASLEPQVPERNDAQATEDAGAHSSSIQATFACAGGKSVDATFDNTNDQVSLGLSDGRSFTLPHARSADGARYANADESFVFWNRGNTAFIQENGTTTYDGCMFDGKQ